MSGSTSFPTFRRRIETMLNELYPMGRPVVDIRLDAASWTVDDSEIWGTCGAYNRLTKLVLLAHRLRIHIALSARRDSCGFHVTAISREIAPTDPAAHHPGLGDLAESCYALAGKASPVQTACALLSKALPYLADALTRFEPGENSEADTLPAEIHRFLQTQQRPT